MEVCDLSDWIIDGGEDLGQGWNTIPQQERYYQPVPVELLWAQFGGLCEQGQAEKELFSAKLHT